MKKNPCFSVEEALKNLKFRTNLINSQQHLLEDPLRNGLLLHQLAQEFTNSDILTVNKINYSPKTLNECRENILIALQSLSKSPKAHKVFFEKTAESILKGDTNFIESLIHFISSTINKTKLPQSIELDSFLKNCSEEDYKIDYYNHINEQEIINWINELKITNTYYKSIEQVTQEIIKGNLLFQIYEKLTHTKIKPVHLFPINESNILANLRKLLNILRESGRFPQKYLWVEKDMIKGDRNSILGFLNDFKKGFENNYTKLQDKTANSPNKINMYYTLQKVEKSITDNDYLGSFDKKMRFKMHSLLSERNFRDNNEKINKKKFENRLNEKNYNEDIIYIWLESLNYSNLVKDLKTQNKFWLQFQDGIILSEIIAHFENIDIKINKQPLCKSDCIKNLREIFKIISKQKRMDRENILFFDEDIVFEGKKNKIIDLLMAIKRIYEKTKKSNLVSPRKSSKKSENYYDKLLKYYILKKNERKKMLIYPKFIDDNHF